MKIVVTGAGGLLGQDIWRLFEKNHTLVALGRTQPGFIPSTQWRQADLTQEALVHDIITRENPDLVVHTAAISNVDGAEKDPDNAFRHNAFVCRNLALACQRFDTVLMSVSTDYVFDGESPTPGGYREFDACRPVNRYGESKYWGEQFVEQLLAKFFIVRTSWLFGPGRKTWVDHVAAAVQSNSEVKAVSDMSSAPTYSPDLAAALLVLAESRHYGYYHLTNTGFCTRIELAEEVARLTGNGRKARIQSLAQSEMGLTARRPRHSGLSNLAWRLDGREPLRSWQSALAAHFGKQGS